MLKSIIKFSSGALAIIIGGIMALFVTRHMRLTESAEQYTDTAENTGTQKVSQTTHDIDSSNTPEETLQSFIDALKKGDVDRAVNYFATEKREEWRDDFAIIKEKGWLGDMIKDLEHRKKEAEDEKTASYALTPKNGENSSLILMKNKSGKWQIYEL